MIADLRVESGEGYVDPALVASDGERGIEPRIEMVIAVRGRPATFHPAGTPPPLLGISTSVRSPQRKSPVTDQLGVFPPSRNSNYAC